MDKKNILDRLSESLGCSNDTELTKLLGVARTTLSSWRSKSSIPIDKLSEIAKKYDLSLDYLVFGKKQDKWSSTGINLQMLEEISCEFELQYKATVEENTAAQWVCFYDFLPEEVKRMARPSDDELEAVFRAVTKRSQMTGLVGNIYNKVASEGDEKERKKMIGHIAASSVMLLNTPGMDQKVIDDLEKLMKRSFNAAKGTQEEVNAPEATTVAQTISGNNHQIAGRDLVNKGKK